MACSQTAKFAGIRPASDEFESGEGRSLKTCGDSGDPSASSDKVALVPSVGRLLLICGQRIFRKCFCTAGICYTEGLVQNCAGRLRHVSHIGFGICRDGCCSCGRLFRSCRILCIRRIAGAAPSVSAAVSFFRSFLSSHISISHSQPVLPVLCRQIRRSPAFF